MNQHLKFNVSVAPYTTYGLGGSVSALASVFDTDSLKRVLQISENYVVLGKGSKVLFSDKGYDGTVILMRSSAFYATKNGIYAESGVSLTNLSRFYAANSLTGLEFAVSIPATIGGALKTNAGAHGEDIGSKVVYLDVLRDGCVKRLSKEDCGFSYRHSAFLGGDIILGACFKAQRGDAEAIKQTREEYVKKRLESQPAGLSCGSVFKNPTGFSSGKLIDECGLKGVNYNGAYISEKHANFILNNGRAKAKDIYTLIRAIKAEVYVKKGVKLEEEVIYIGEF